jgi:Bax protein
MKKILLLITLIPLLNYAGFNEFFNISHNPDFAKIRDVKERKTAFFNYLLPVIQVENQRILALREKIKFSNDGKFLDAIAKKYNSKKNKNDLLARIDIIPSSLALAQAANESSWGRSRFARYYNNFFGLWCFTKGCGVVPKKRNNGKSHEVAKFTSLADCVEYYMLTLNRHRSYKKLRDIRLNLRNTNQQISGNKLSYGLEKYSGIGHNYIKALNNMIRINKLARFD